MTDDIPVSTRILDRLVGGGLALAAFILYLFTLAPTVLEADSGEFQFTAWLPGITHPTGYPLYTLLGWLWTHLLPLGEVAWRMNLLSAALAAATVGLTYAIARAMLNLTLPDTPRSGRILAALVSAGIFAVTPTFWSQAIIAEVYALHTLFVALILWLALKVNRPTSLKWLIFTFGLSLTHHRTMVLLLPALGAYGLWTALNQNQTEKIKRQDAKTQRREAFKISRRMLIWLMILACAPLLLYLYLPLVAPHTPYATLHLSQNQTLVLYDQSLRGFWNHIWGTVFTGEVQPAAFGIDRLRLTWEFLHQQVGWPGTLLALAGLVTLWQRRRVDLLLLTGLGSLGFALFNLVYFIGDIYVLFIPVWLFVCLWLGLGALGLAHWLAVSFVRRKTGSRQNQVAFATLEHRLNQTLYRWLVMGMVGLCFLGLIIITATRSVAVSQADNTAARDRWQVILAEPLPNNAILVSNDRNEIMPLWYYQYVEGRRPDLLGLFPLIVTDPAYSNVGRVLDQALASGRPVYLIKPMDGLGLKADLTPVGNLYRTAANHAPPTYPREVNLEGQTGRLKLLGYDLLPVTITPGDTITVTLHWQAVEPLSVDYTSYVHLVNAAGEGITQSDHLPGGEFYPSHYWQPGEILRDHHTFTLPAAVTPGDYRLRVGLYYQPAPGILENLGNGVEIGRVSIAVP